MVKFFCSLLAGATYPLLGLDLLRRTPQLRGYVLIPILVNLIIGITLYLGLLVAGFQGIDTLLLHLSLPTWASAGEVALPVLDWLLRILLSILLLLTTGFLLVQFGVVLGSPWYGMLSEQLEKIRMGQLPPAEPMKASAIFRDVGRALSFELKKLLLLASGGLLLLLLSFIPPVGPFITGVGGVILSATILCLDFLNTPLERRQLSFRTKLGILKRNLPASATFGLVCLVLVSIPLVNLLSIPLCVTAGTLFFCDRIQPQLTL